MYKKYKRKHGKAGTYTHEKAIAFFSLPPEPTSDEVKQAYRSMLKTLHPDVTGKSSEDASLEISKAMVMRDALLHSLEKQTASGPCPKCLGKGQIRLPGFNNYVKCRKCTGEVYDEQV